jgi:DNA-directed RNA polymerase subunit RPC12/RpoP
MAKIALWVRCQRCGAPFDTGLRLDERSFARGTLAANYHTCPHCGARETYRKADYDGRAARPGRPATAHGARAAEQRPPSETRDTRSDAQDTRLHSDDRSIERDRE